MMREVKISWRGGGVGRGAAPSCSKSKEIVLMLHGNLRCLRQKPLKRIGDGISSTESRGSGPR